MYRLHDAEIVGLQHEDDRLVVTLCSEAGRRCVMAFTQVLDWSFSPFEPQNVILDFYAYNQATLSEHILAFFGLMNPLENGSTGARCTCIATRPQSTWKALCWPKN
jgi:hypothetical protein